MLHRTPLLVIILLTLGVACHGKKTTTPSELPQTKGPTPVVGPGKLAQTPAEKQLDALIRDLEGKKGSRVNLAETFRKSIPDLSEDPPELDMEGALVQAVIPFRGGPVFAALVLLRGPEGAGCEADGRRVLGVAVVKDPGSGREKIDLQILFGEEIDRLFVAENLRAGFPDTGLALPLFTLSYDYQNEKDPCVDRSKPMEGSFLELFTLQFGGFARAMTVPLRQREFEPGFERITRDAMRWERAGKQAVLVLTEFRSESNIETGGVEEGRTITCSLGSTLWTHGEEDWSAPDAQAETELRKANPGLGRLPADGEGATEQECRTLESALP